MRLKPVLKKLDNLLEESLGFFLGFFQNVKIQVYRYSIKKGLPTKLYKVLTKLLEIFWECFCSITPLKSQLVYK